jgi:hypothetical protein
LSHQRESSWLYYVLLVVVCVLAINMANAQTCITPTENFNETSTGLNVFCSGTYYLNDTDGNGVFWTNKSNVIIRCNGTIFNGNLSGGSIGFRSAGSVSNITVEDCTFKEYNVGAKVTSYNGVYFYNNTLINNSLYGLEWSGDVKNSQFVNNTFRNSTFYVQSNKLGNITGNVWMECGTRYCGNSKDYNLILFSTAISNLSVSNNSFKNARMGIYVSGISSGIGNVSIFNNNFRDSDVGIRVANYLGSSPLLIYNNVFNNLTNGDDAYNLGLDINKASNVVIAYNNFSEQTDMAMQLQNVTNINITGNVFNLICIENRSNYLSNPQNEPCTAIKIGQYFKTWNYATCSNGYQWGCARNTINKDIVIKGNVFNNETNVYLMLEGVFNVSHDLSNYWYRSFEFVNYTNKTELFISDGWSEVKSSLRMQNFTTRNKNFYVGMELTNLTYYSVSKDRLLFWNDAYNVTDVVLFDWGGSAKDVYYYNSSIWVGADILTYNFSLPLSTQKTFNVTDGGCNVVPVNDVIVQPSTVLCNGSGYVVNNYSVNASGGNWSVNRSLLGRSGVVSGFTGNDSFMRVTFFDVVSPFDDVWNGSRVIASGITGYTVVLTGGSWFFVSDFTSGGTVTGCVGVFSSLNGTFVIFLGFFGVIIMVIVGVLLVKVVRDDDLDLDLLKMAVVGVVLTGLVIGVGILMMGTLEGIC